MGAAGKGRERAGAEAPGPCAQGTPGRLVWPARGCVGEGSGLLGHVPGSSGGQDSALVRSGTIMGFEAQG